MASFLNQIYLFKVISKRRVNRTIEELGEKSVAERAAGRPAANESLRGASPEGLAYVSPSCDDVPVNLTRRRHISRRFPPFFIVTRRASERRDIPRGANRSGGIQSR